MGIRTALLIGLVAAVPVASGAAQGDGAKPAAEVDYEKMTLAANTFNVAASCGACHIDIYALWKQSMHAKALVDPVFQATFQDARIQRDERVKALCLQCHAPTLHYDPALTSKSSLVAEGVTCDFCHSIQGVDLSNTTKPFQVAWGRVKRGPLKDSQSPVHETQQSPLFSSGELCGACHQMLNVNSLPIITTYEEWQGRYYKKVGENTCQDCHMPLAAGFTVSAKNRKTKQRINLHSFPGGHSRVQLLDALQLDILEEARIYGKMRVKLGLSNTGAGHAIPTGNPLRTVVVDFSAFDASNRLIHNEKIELAKKFADGDGKTLTTDLGVLLDASKVVSDNRVGPGETREMIFEFLAPEEKILVEARVTYVYRSPALPEGERREELIHFTRVVNKERAGRTM